MPARIDFGDCFRAGVPHRALADALAQVDATLASVVGTERIGLRAALGRIPAEDIVSDRDVPPHDNSAMDGYAVYFDDLNPAVDTTLARGPRIAAGHPHGEPITRGLAVQIFTGAPMPDGPDTVVMAEDVQEEGERVIVPAGVVRGTHVRRTGEDVKRGDVVLRVGARLRPQDIGMIASVGRTDVAVYNRLRVAVFSTGDELREPGSVPSAGTIFDINRYTVMAMLERLGCAVTDLGILPDNAIAIRAALSAAAEGHDLLLTSGGVSQGGEDRVREAVIELGAVNFWTLATKPGRVVALGHVTSGGGRDVAFIGLPGNPVALAVMFLTIARPIVLRLAGAAVVKPASFRVRAGFSIDKKAGRREWLRARLTGSADGPVAQKFSDDGSGILSSMVDSDGLVELGEDVTRVRPGDLIDFLPYGELMG